MVMEAAYYKKIGVIGGRGKADIIESLLTAEGIEVELVQGAITHYIYKGALDTVHIYVPNTKIAEALDLLKYFEEFEPEDDNGE
jgi:hypothetical protein